MRLSPDRNKCKNPGPFLGERAMAFNDIFRMVSLRHSKTSPSAPGSIARPDPRLRYRSLLEGQATTVASPRDNKLNQLKGRHVELAKKAVQLESIQRAVIDAYMLEQQEKTAPKYQPGPPLKPAPAPATGTGRRTAAAGSAATGVASRAAAVATAASMQIADRSGFIKRVETRLSDAGTSLFHDLVGTAAAGAHLDLSDLMAGLNVGAVLEEANDLCTQIQAIQDDSSDGLPTVPAQSASSTDPIIAAVGWGDLIVARESLVGYEAREISHIENILPGEAKLREHQRLSKTEEVQETETTTEKESEKDSQTTDRFELQAESQETISRDFSITAGVNTSGQYGLTHVDTSLDAAFSQSEAQSRSSSINTAREIVTKAVERTFERVRKLRRLTITEEIRELNRHELTNTAGTAPPKALSGMYLWVEKIQKIELRHYGTRMMIEFHVPEPAVSLHERTAIRNVRKKLPPFDVAPGSIQPGNYMCLAQRYAASDVEPPPTLLIEVGYGWVSKLNEDDDAWGEDQFTSTINIPKGYRPTWAKVAWSGLQGKSENRDFNFAFSIAGLSQGIEHTTPTYDGVVLRLRGDSDWPQGVPVAGRVHGAWDGAMYVQATVSCTRTTEAMDAWRLKTWQQLRAGYEDLERRVTQEEQQQAYDRSLQGPLLNEGPAAENRRVERGELQKWAIKSMRLAPQNFNAIEQVGEFQEMNPVGAQAQAPIVRFYEDAFEWEHMNYFLHPYHWARRASWRMRTAAQAADPQYQAFLEAGAARVIVPVTPGFEDKVAWFLDPANAATSELERILAQPPATPPAASGDTFRDLWVELLMEHKPDVARGSGTLSVQSGSAVVAINPQTNPDTQWHASTERDLGREIYLSGNRYEVTAVTSDSQFSIDRPYEGASDAAAVYVAGSTPFGPPWTVNVPTTLVVLADNVPALRAL
jgi:hypothetical protein